jgi:hypothetical protein
MENKYKKNYKEFKNKEGKVIGATWTPSEAEMREYHEEEYRGGML